MKINYIVAIDILEQKIENSKDSLFISACKVAIEALKNQITDNWIPISERLPEENKAVLLYMDNGVGETKQVVGYLYQTDKEEFKPFNGQFSVDIGTLPDFLVQEYIKAWKVLPKPYREKIKDLTDEQLNSLFPLVPEDKVAEEFLREMAMRARKVNQSEWDAYNHKEVSPMFLSMYKKGRKRNPVVFLIGGNENEKDNEENR